MRQDVNIPLILTVGVVSVLLLVVVILGAQAWFAYQRELERQRKWAAAPVIREMVTLQDLRSQQLASLGKYAWADQQKQTVVIPIEQAISVVAADPSLLLRKPTTQPSH